MVSITKREYLELTEGVAKREDSAWIRAIGYLYTKGVIDVDAAIEANAANPYSDRWLTGDEPKILERFEIWLRGEKSAAYDEGFRDGYNDAATYHERPDGEHEDWDLTHPTP